MMLTVECPCCGARLGLDGHGQCACGAYLFHHYRKVRRHVRPENEPESVWDMGLRPPELIPSKALQDYLWR